ncbi:MAG: hypothetical protein FJ399_13130 [Verrucomicrobia bacterium]|nr:hypothetical protein [Verrucomicrobiota bacterium]
MPVVEAKDGPRGARPARTKVVQTRSIPFALEATGVRVEPIEVDTETQARMDEVAAVWKKRRANRRSA